VPNATLPENFAKFRRRVLEIFDVKCFDILPEVAPLNRKPEVGVARLRHCLVGVFKCYNR